MLYSSASPAFQGFVILQSLLATQLIDWLSNPEIEVVSIFRLKAGILFTLLFRRSRSVRLFRFPIELGR